MVFESKGFTGPLRKTVGSLQVRNNGKGNQTIPKQHIPVFDTNTKFTTKHVSTDSPVYAYIVHKCAKTSAHTYNSSVEKLSLIQNKQWDPEYLYTVITSM